MDNAGTHGRAGQTDAPRMIRGILMPNSGVMNEAPTDTKGF